MDGVLRWLRLKKAVPPASAASTPVPVLAGERVFRVSDDAAYMALVDVRTYEPALPDWDYESLTRKLVAAMNAGQVMAWGHPEENLDVRITLRPPSPEVLARADASTAGVLRVTGDVCLAGYTPLTMCAQFPKHSLATEPDTALFRVAPGTYRVTVYRLFAHEDGAQGPRDGELPSGDHYVVHLEPTREPVSVSHDWVPWAPR